MTSPPAPFEGHTGPIRAVGISPVGTNVATCGEDGAVRVWDLASGAAHETFLGQEGQVRALRLTGTECVTCDDRGAIRTWQPPSGTPAVTATGHRGTVSAAAITDDGGHVVTAGINGVQVWSRSGGSREIMSGRDGWVRAVTVTPAELEIITCDSKGVVRVWDISGYLKEKPSGGTGSVRALTTSRNGIEIITGGGNGTVWVWDRRARRLAAFTGPAGGVRTVAVAPDGRLIAGTDDGAIQVWDRERPTEPTVLDGHTRQVNGIAVTPDGRRLVSVGDDGTIRVWDLDDSIQVAGTGFTVRRPSPRPEVTSDAASARDLLGFHEDVHTLAALITDRATEPPLCIALLGPWGSGKSSFMLQLHERVDTLAELSRKRPGAGTFASNVRQVRFNAWHYSDDHLWVGLVEHLFETLADPEAPPDPDALRSERTSLRARLDQLRAQQEIVRRVLAREGGLLRIPALLLAIGWRAAIVAVAGAGVAAAGVLWGNLTVSLLGAVVAVATPVLTGVAKAWRAVGRLPGSLRHKLETREQHLDRELRDIGARLDRLDAAQRLAGLIQEVRSGRRYEQYRGVLGRVHEDLRRLSDDLKAAGDEWRRAGSHGPPPLERIVLYIDDLDRCPPGKVADVLAAVHLLLALPLFVVVVAVDPRWLRGSLEQTSKPLEYLDKIFQVTFALRPMGQWAEDLMDTLLPPDVQESTPDKQTSNNPAGTARPTPPRFGESAGNPHADPRPAARTPPEPDLRSARLSLRAEERAFVRRLLPLLATPRQAKKLANLYRLVRIGIPDDELESFIGRNGVGPYQAVLVLLAVIVATPGAAREMLIELRGSGDGDIADLLSTPELIADIRKDTEVYGDLAGYRAWAGTVARFSFETYDLVTGA